MRLSVRHATLYTYDPPADRAAVRLKLYPAPLNNQAILSWMVTVNGAPTPPILTNGFGDAEGVWTSQIPVDAVEVIAEGEIETRDCAGVVTGLKDVSRPAVFLRQTALTATGDRARALVDALPPGALLSRLHALRDAVREAIDYVPGVTTADTSAELALEGGKGVCQDHAHAFIAAARALGTPARYVAGYMLPDGATLAETHAWAEAFVPDIGWIGFDPTNRICPTDRYVRLSSGFDAADAAPLRGNLSGAVKETLSARVDIAQVQRQQ